MISFFRDFLDGPIYLILVVVCIILIMAIIGFIMERKKFEKEERNRIAVVGGEVTPIKAVNARQVIIEKPDDLEEKHPIHNSITNPEEDLKRDSTFTIDSNEVKVPEVVTVSEPVEEIKVEDITPVVDFGITDNVTVETPNDTTS